MMNDIDDEWNRFQLGEDIDFGVVKDDANTSELDDNIVAPECEPLYISTTTKVLYLNQSIDREYILENSNN